MRVDRRSPLRRPRILHVLTRLVAGGAQENTLLTVERLDPSRFEIDLASGPGGGPEGSLDDRARRLGGRYHPIPTLVRNPSPGKDLRALLHLFTLMRAKRYDIVHTHTTKAGILGRLAARAAGVPIIIHTPHGHVFHGYLPSVGVRLYVAAERTLARMTDRIVCLTRSEADDDLAFGVGRPDQLAVIHSGVAIERFTPSAVGANRAAQRRELGLPATGPLVACVARLVPIKGQATLIRAMSTVVQRIPEAVLVLVGDGPDRQPLDRLSAEIGLRDRVRFLGLRADVPALMPVFDLVVLPSLNEGMGRAAVEALAAGKPVVASNIVGLRDVVTHSRTGLLVPPGDAAELAGAIIALLENPLLRETMGQAGMAEAPRFSVSAMIQGLARLYEELLGERTRPPWSREDAGAAITAR